MTSSFEWNAVKNKTASYTVTVCILIAAQVLLSGSACGQVVPSLAERIHNIITRKEFKHSRFGIDFFSLDTGKPIFELNQDELFVPGSTTKLLTEGTALELLGGEYRFHTRLYKTGPIQADGTLAGDLILVASGDSNLSGRIQPDGTLGFENEDHSYGGLDSRGLPGDPLFVIRELAQQVAEKRIKRVQGHVFIDTSLFPEGQRELGTHVVLSPIVVNDNLIDVLIGPSTVEGAPAILKISPRTTYIKFIDKTSTGKAGSESDVQYDTNKSSTDGNLVVTVSGSYPMGQSPVMSAYAVPEPSRFAATVLVEALREKGIEATIAAYGERSDFQTLSTHYTPENLVAEHISPPLKEDVRITLKVSQNLHASMVPFLLGALVGHKTDDIEQAGFDLEKQFLTRAGLDLTGAAQSDGSGGNAFFTPDFMVHFLAFMTRQKNFADFHRGLPILGRDGTLAKIQVNVPAAGHIFAKTGTYTTSDALNRRAMVSGKGLAGYMETRDGRHLALALYANFVSVPEDDPDAAQNIVGQALGEIAAAAYDSPADSRDRDR